MYLTFRYRGYCSITMLANPNNLEELVNPDDLAVLQEIYFDEFMRVTNEQTLCDFSWRVSQLVTQHRLCRHIAHVVDDHKTIRQVHWFPHLESHGIVVPKTRLIYTRKPQCIPKITWLTHLFPDIIFSITWWQTLKALDKIYERNRAAAVVGGGVFVVVGILFMVRAKIKISLNNMLSPLERIPLQFRANRANVDTLHNWMDSVFRKNIRNYASNDVCHICYENVLTLLILTVCAHIRPFKILVNWNRQHAYSIYDLAVCTTCYSLDAHVTVLKKVKLQIKQYNDRIRRGNGVRVQYVHKMFPQKSPIPQLVCEFAYEPTVLFDLFPVQCSMRGLHSEYKFVMT